MLVKEWVMQRYVERVNAYLDTWLKEAGYQRIHTEFVEEDHQHYLRVYIDFAEEAFSKDAEQEETDQTAAGAAAQAEDLNAGSGTADEANNAADDSQAETETAEADAQSSREETDAAHAEEETPRGIGINDCANVSRRLSKWLDKEDFISEMYTLEVCSRGFLNEPKAGNAQAEDQAEAGTKAKRAGTEAKRKERNGR